MLTPRLWLGCEIALSLLLPASFFGQQPTRDAKVNAGTINFQVIDSATGIEIDSATITSAPVVPGGSAFVAGGQSLPNGHILEKLSVGEYLFEISAPNHKSMRTHFPVSPGATSKVTVNLDPIQPPVELQEQTTAPKLREHQELVHGYVVDSVTRLPIRGVDLKLAETGDGAVTDTNGYFELYANANSTENISDPKAFPELDQLRATATGYKTYTLKGLLHVPKSESVVRIAMTPGSGSQTKDSTPRPLRPPERDTTSPPPSDNTISEAGPHKRGCPTSRF